MISHVGQWQSTVRVWELCHPPSEEGLSKPKGFIDVQICLSRKNEDCNKMKCKVTFRHMKTSDSIREYVEDKVSKLDRLLNEDRSEVHVVLSVEKLQQIAHFELIIAGAVFFFKGSNIILNFVIFFFFNVLRTIFS